MRNQLVPILFVLVLPASYLAWRLGLLTYRRLRWIGGLGVAATVLWSLPWQGVELLFVKRINLLIAAATALFLLLHHLRIRWTLQRSRRLVVWTGLAALAVLNYTNYFAFHGHGTRAFVHLHDVAHYYLGAKYYTELGYTNLYTAMLRAEAELTGDRFKATEARDLVTYERVHILPLLRRSEPVKAAFTDERWQEFQDDVDFFRRRLNADQWGRILLDHGFNPTPVWAQIGGTLAGWVPGGSPRGILLLCLLDPLLLAVLFVAIARTFGLETMLLAVIHFCVIFGGTFGWTGGAFLRYAWLAALLVGLCCLHRRKHFAAGTLLAIATALRVFPVFFLLPLLCKAASTLWRRRALPARYQRLFGSFAATLAVLFASTLLLPKGLDHWREFRVNMSNHVANISPNVVGLTEALAFQPGDRKVTEEEFAELKQRRRTIYRVQQVVVFLPAVLLVGWLCSRRTDLAAAALALPLLYLGLSLAAYYYVMLVALILVHRHSTERLALIFTVEAAPYVLMLFEDRDGLLFVYRGLTLVFLYLVLELPATRLPSPRRQEPELAQLQDS